MADKQCDNHPLEPAVTVCSSCRRPLCPECWRRNVNGNPWCELCLHHLTSTGGRLAVAVTFFLVCTGVAALGWRWESAHSHERSLPFWISFAVIACAASIYLAVKKTKPGEMRIEARPNETPTVQPSAKVGRPYRAAFRNASRIVASPVSGVWTATLLLACMFVAAITLPGLLHLPRWIEAEVVIVVWWAVWTTTLGVLLYRGFRLSDDHVLALPRAPWARSEESKRKANDVADALSGCDPTGGVDADGCAVVAVVVVLLIASLAAVWLLVELAVPALFFLAYLLVRTSLARVANDHHGCEHRLGRALWWGTVWASAYALPLAFAVFLAQHFLRPN